MSRLLLVWLRSTAALLAGLCTLATVWGLREGQPGIAGFVAAVAVTVAVFLVTGRPEPKPWGAPPRAPTPKEPDAR